MNKKEAWNYYRDWGKSKTINPVLGEVKITRLGWNHVINGSKSKSRKLKDRNVRISLLKEVKNLLGKARTYNFRIVGSYKYYELKAKRFRGKGQLKVIIREDSDGIKTLYS